MAFRLCSHLQLCFKMNFYVSFMYPSYMLSLSREMIYEGLRLRPIAYMYAFSKGLRPRLYIAKQLIVNMPSVSMSGMPGKGCLFPGTTEKLHIFILLLFSIYIVHLPNCVIAVLLHVLNFMLSFLIAASCSLVDLGYNFLKM